LNIFKFCFDNNEFVELDKNMTLKILCICGHKKYADRLKDVMEKPNLKMPGRKKGKPKELVICCFALLVVLWEL
jgi:acetyl-CoA carboxylase beta subunit